MIDDGKHDPPEIKIENHVGSLTHFKAWEQELQAKPVKPRKRLSDRLWAFLEAVGQAYAHGGY